MRLHGMSRHPPSKVQHRNKRGFPPTLPAPQPQHDLGLLRITSLASLWKSSDVAVLHIARRKVEPSTIMQSNAEVMIAVRDGQGSIISGLTLSR